MEIKPQKVLKIETACPNGYLNSRGRPTICLWSGLLVGISIAIVSSIIGFLPTGRRLNDPMPIALAFNSLLRGFVYFNWVRFFTSIGFSTGIGAMSWFSGRYFSNRIGVRLMSDEVRRVSNVAVIVSVVPVWLQEVDALQIFLWYGIATAISLTIAKMVAIFLHQTFSLGMKPRI